MKILIIDDDVVDLMMPFVEALVEAGHCVLRATDATQGYELAVEHQLDLDLVIWDMMINPGARYAAVNHDGGTQTGRFLFRELQQLLPTLPKLLVTNSRNDQLTSEFEMPDHHSFARRKRDLPIRDFALFIEALGGRHHAGQGATRT